MLELIVGTLLICGAVFVLLSSIGLIRMPDLFMRMSSTTKAVTLGVGFILIGSAVFFNETGITARAFVIILFLFITAPIGAHMIGRAAYFDKVPLWKETKTDELKGKYNENDHRLNS